ncbi:NAD(P)H-binding protein [Parasediminibacterium paludis]|uniref:NAD(P)H-binding protein n=1 Tax=Parasediminibacterium paludis TaxID=908966 RepID=A0ABV8PVK8_9BACT
MKKVIITGANGMIGSLIVDMCLSRVDVAQVTCITRKPLALQHPKLVNVVHDNFTDYTTITEHLQQQDICFYCIGVYTGQVPAAEFNAITIDYTIAFAKALREQNASASFCFLSGQGADSSEKSKILFAKAKGIAENQLLALQFAHTYIFRPGYIYPVTPRKEPNSMYLWMRRLYKLMVKIYPNVGVTSVQLAAKMVAIGFDGGTKTIYENADIRA